MRWCSFTSPTGGPGRLGAAGPDGRVLDVTGWARSRQAETPADLVDLVSASPATQERVTDLVRSAPVDGVGWVRPEEVHLLAPLRTAGTLRHVLARSGSLPVFAHGPRRGLLGPSDALDVPAYTSQLDVALHVAAVLGRPGRDVEPADAAATVFGYSLLLVWSARDAARDLAAHLGPWLVTPDEWEPRGGHASSLLDLPSCTTDAVPATPGQVLSWVSRGEDLCATDVVGLGVLAAARDTSAWVTGDVQASVEGLGSLSVSTGLGVGA